MIINSEVPRLELLEKVGEIAEIVSVSLSNTLTEDGFENLASYPAETIPHTVNGYQKFLSEQLNSADNGKIVAGYIMNMKSLLLQTFGKAILTELQNEFFTRSPTEEVANNDTSATSLWDIAFRAHTGDRPSPAFDALTAYLLLTRMKWLLVRTNANMEDKK